VGTCAHPDRAQARIITNCFIDLFSGVRLRSPLSGRRDTQMIAPQWFPVFPTAAISGSIRSPQGRHQAHDHRPLERSPRFVGADARNLYCPLPGHSETGGQLFPHGLMSRWERIGAALNSKTAIRVKRMVRMGLFYSLKTSNPERLPKVTAMRSFIFGKMAFLG